MLDISLEVGGQTKAERARAVLAAEIADGRLPPGAKLDEVQLASRFRMSRTPVREAIKQLHAMGLVEHLPHRGARVVGVPVAHLLEAYGLMLAGCVELATGRMDADGRRRIETANDEAEALAALACGLNNPLLAEVLLAMEARARPYLGDTIRLREVVRDRRGRKAGDAVRQSVSGACRRVSARP